MKPRIIAVIAALVLILIIVLVVMNRRKVFLYAGTIEATEVDLSARIPAVIAAIPVGEGGVVNKDDVVVQLSADDIRVAAEAAERDFQRARKLLDSGTMTQDAYDKIKYKRDDAQVRFGWATIRSPINGTVLTKYREPGEMVSPGTKLLNLADLSRVWAYVYVPQPMLGKISLGMAVPGYIPESDMREVKGTVIKINSEAEFTPKNVQTRTERTRLVYGVKIEFVNTDGILKPGMSVEVKLPENK